MNSSPIKKSLSSQMRSASENLTMQAKKSSTLPNLKPVKFSETIQFDSPFRERDQFTRLSGLKDPYSSTGLFRERTTPLTPSVLCVRCGSSASLCVPCSDLMCENAIIFYRKTRAAGAAALFTKSFTEAGNSRLVKFLIFRLLKNSFTSRFKKQTKMKNVVEKMFGQNLVLVPFTAWKRYTKANIISRKDRTIQTLQEKVASLDAQVASLNAATKHNDIEVKKLKTEIDRRIAIDTEQKNKISFLEAELKHEQKRVVGLAALAKPLQAYSSLIDSIMFQETNNIRHYLHHAATNVAGHNYSHIFESSVLDDLSDMYYRRSANLNNNHINASQFMGKELVVSSQIAVDWLMNQSEAAAHHVDPNTGKPLSRFLPMTFEASENNDNADAVQSIADLKSGRDLIRAVICVIYDLVKDTEINHLTDRKRMNIRTAERAAVSTASNESTEESAADTNDSQHESKEEAPHHHVAHINRTPRTFRPVRVLSLEELHKLKEFEDHPLDLVSFALKMAIEILGVPHFRSMEIYAGNTYTIHAFIVSLMIASKPSVHKEESTAIGVQIGKYQDIMAQLEHVYETKQMINSIESIEEMRLMHTGHDAKHHVVTLEALEGLMQSLCTPGNSEENADELQEQFRNWQQATRKKLSVDLSSESLDMEQMAPSTTPKHGSLRRSMGSMSKSFRVIQQSLIDQGVGVIPEDSYAPEHSALNTEPNTVHLEPTESMSKDGVETSDAMRLSKDQEEHQKAIEEALKRKNTPVTKHDTYKVLGHAIDNYIKRADDGKMLKIADENFQLTENLIHLLRETSALRDKRETGVRMTTELMQFVMSNFVETSLQRADVLVEAIEDV